MPDPADAESVDAESGRADTRSGPGRILVSVYAVFAVAATARSLVQMLTKFDEAPLAYLLSGLAGVIYCVATYGLASRRSWSWLLAVAAVTTELTGVLVVGTLSVADDSLFPDQTVWSNYGSGYGYVPLVLPFVGLWWLWIRRPTGASRLRLTS
jgi:hypothetical protein